MLWPHPSTARGRDRHSDQPEEHTQANKKKRRSPSFRYSRSSLFTLRAITSRRADTIDRPWCFFVFLLPPLQCRAKPQRRKHRDEEAKNAKRLQSRDACKRQKTQLCFATALLDLSSTLCPSPCRPSFSRSCILCLCVVPDILASRLLRPPFFFLTLVARLAVFSFGLFFPNFVFQFRIALTFPSISLSVCVCVCVCTRISFGLLFFHVSSLPKLSPFHLFCLFGFAITSLIPSLPQALFLSTTAAAASRSPLPTLCTLSLDLALALLLLLISFILNSAARF